MAQLIRCNVTTPYRVRCNCPMRWDPDRGWIHNPSLETGVGEPLGSNPLDEVIKFHRIHVGIDPRTTEEAARGTTRADGLPDRVYTCPHEAQVDDGVTAFTEAARDGKRPRDWELVLAGQWVKRQGPPPPDGRKPTMAEAMEKALRSLERNGVPRELVLLAVTAVPDDENDTEYELHIGRTETLDVAAMQDYVAKDLAANTHLQMMALHRNRHCPACGSPRYAVKQKAEDYKPHSWDECLDCGHKEERK